MVNQSNINCRFSLKMYVIYMHVWFQGEIHYAYYCSLYFLVSNIVTANCCILILYLLCFLFQVFSTFGGYAACIIIGFIFVFFMPIVGLIYCCCHCCCHKCGGTREEKDPPRAACKRWTVFSFLFVCTMMML